MAIQSVAYPTRLETQTKESNMCASHWEALTYTGEMKVKTRLSRLGKIAASASFRRRRRCAHYWPVSSASAVRRSKSAHVGSRQIVNYAWEVASGRLSDSSGCHFIKTAYHFCPAIPFLSLKAVDNPFISASWNASRCKSALVIGSMAS